MNYAEALKKAKGRDGSVEVKARRKSGAKREAENFNRIHAYILAGSDGGEGGS
jgi:hypothetical protein